MKEQVLQIIDSHIRSFQRVKDTFDISNLSEEIQQSIKYSHQNKIDVLKELKTEIEKL